MEKKPQRCYEYVQNEVFAIDFDEKSVRVARCLNLIAGDGQTSVEKHPSRRGASHLANVPNAVIRSRLGVSRWYAGKIRQGYRPHPRHWEALAKLAGLPVG
jgi:hypothetical protein